MASQTQCNLGFLIDQVYKRAILNYEEKWVSDGAKILSKIVTLHNIHFSPVLTKATYTKYLFTASFICT